jgi:hypothetical protein
MNEESVQIVMNPLVPLQDYKKENLSWSYKFKRFRQDPPWGAILMCSACFAFGLTLLIMLILNVKEFSMN